MTELPDRLFHGGVDGLKPGDLILPHPPKFHAGCAACEANARGEDFSYGPLWEAKGNGAPVVYASSPATQHPEHVYISSDRAYSRYYASKYGLGDLYRVEPVGEVVESVEDPFPTWRCSSARVVAVVERAVRLTDAQRRTLINRWTAADRAALAGVRRGQA